MEQEIALGDVVKDPITGAVGTVVAITEYLTGCNRASVQLPGLNKEMKAWEWLTFDVPTLKIVSKLKVPAEKRKTGGPQPKVSKYN